jgi:putative Holliday junction resolvase
MEKLERRFDFPVELWDERLTTAQARNIMTESGIRGDMQKEYVDEIAAMLILQGYLDSLQMKKKEQAD